MENLFTLTKTAASVKNIIIEFKLQDEPLLKIFVNTFNNSPYLNWQEVRDWIKERGHSKNAPELRQYITSVLMSKLRRKAPYDLIQNLIGNSFNWENFYYESNYRTDEDKERIRTLLGESNYILSLDMEKEAKILENDPNPDVREALSCFPNDPETAERKLLTIFNMKKSQFFKLWLNEMSGNFSESPEFQFLVLLPILDFSPNTKKTPTLDFWGEVVWDMYNSFKENPNQSTKILKVYKKTFDKVAEKRYHYVNFQKGVESGRWLFIPSKKKSDEEPEKYGEFEDNVSLLMHYGNLNGWCVGQEGTATSYLTDGDFFLYLDANEAARIAIRFSGDNISELRGERNQDKRLEPYWRETVAFIQSQDWEDKLSSSHIYARLKTTYEINHLMEEGEEGKQKAIDVIVNDYGKFDNLTKQNKDKLSGELEEMIAAKIIQDPMSLFARESMTFLAGGLAVLPKIRAALMQLPEIASTEQRIKLYYFWGHYGQWASVWNELEELTELWNEDKLKSWTELISQEGSFSVQDKISGDNISNPKNALLAYWERNGITDQIIQGYLNEDNPNTSRDGLKRLVSMLPFQTQDRILGKVNEIKEKQKNKLWLNNIRQTNKFIDSDAYEMPVELLESEDIRKEFIRIINDTDDFNQVDNAVTWSMIEKIDQYEDLQKVCQGREIIWWTNQLKKGFFVTGAKFGGTPPQRILDNPIFIKEFSDRLRDRDWEYSARLILEITENRVSNIQSMFNTSPRLFNGVAKSLSGAIKRRTHTIGNIDDIRDKLNALSTVSDFPFIEALGLEKYINRKEYDIVIDFIENTLPNTTSRRLWAFKNFISSDILKNSFVQDKIHEVVINKLKRYIDDPDMSDSSFKTIFTNMPSLIHIPEIEELLSKITYKKIMLSLKNVTYPTDLVFAVEPILLKNKAYYDVVLEKITKAIPTCNDLDCLNQLKKTPAIDYMFQQNPKLYGKYVVRLKELKKQQEKRDQQATDNKGKILQPNGNLSFWEMFATQKGNWMHDEIELLTYINRNLDNLDDRDDSIVDAIVKDKKKTNYIVKALESLSTTLAGFTTKFSSKLFEKSEKIKATYLKIFKNKIQSEISSVANDYYHNYYAGVVCQTFLGTMPQEIYDIPELHDKIRKFLIKFFHKYIGYISGWDMDGVMDHHTKNNEIAANAKRRFKELVYSDPEIKKILDTKRKRSIEHKSPMDLMKIPERFKTKKIKEKIKNRIREYLEEMVNTNNTGGGLIKMGNPDSIPQFVKKDPEIQELLAKVIGIYVAKGIWSATSQITKPMLDNEQQRGYIVDGYKKAVEYVTDPGQYSAGGMAYKLIEHVVKKKRPEFINKFIKEVFESIFKEIPLDKKTLILNVIRNYGYSLDDLVSSRQGKETFNIEGWGQAWMSHLMKFPSGIFNAPKAIKEYIFSDKDRTSDLAKALLPAFDEYMLYGAHRLPTLFNDENIQKKIKEVIVPTTVQDIKDNRISLDSQNIKILGNYPEVTEAIVNMVLSRGHYKWLIDNWNDIPSNVKKDPRIQHVLQGLFTQSNSWYSFIKMSSVSIN